METSYWNIWKRLPSMAKGSECLYERWHKSVLLRVIWESHGKFSGENIKKNFFLLFFFLRICCFPWDIRMCVGWGLYFPLPETFETLNDIHTVETEGEKKSLPGTESWCLPSWCQASFSGAGYVRLVLYRITLPSAFFRWQSAFWRALQRLIGEGGGAATPRNSFQLQC